MKALTCKCSECILGRKLLQLNVMSGKWAFAHMRSEHTRAGPVHQCAQPRGRHAAAPGRVRRRGCASPAGGGCRRRAAQSARAVLQRCAARIDLAAVVALWWPLSLTLIVRGSVCGHRALLWLCMTRSTDIGVHFIFPFRFRPNKLTCCLWAPSHRMLHADMPSVGCLPHQW